MENSHIQWTDNTQNFWIGCTKVSAGCAHCYAEARDVRFNGGIHWGKGAPRQRTTAGNWREPFKWNSKSELDALRFGMRSAQEIREARANGTAYRRPRVFCSSLSDIFDGEVAIEWFLEAMNVIRQCDSLDWQLLTKRPENFRERVAGAINYLSRGEATKDSYALIEWLQGWQSGNDIPRNIWMGTSVENQECFDRRVPDLLKIPAKIRFLSAEPLLGPIDLGMYSVNDAIPNIHWCIIGGESGSNARPFDIAWAQSLVAQCRDAGVAPFVKQLGANVWTNSDPLSFEMRRAEWPIDTEFRYATGNHTIHLKDRKGGDWDEWAPELRVREFPA